MYKIARKRTATAGRPTKLQNIRAVVISACTLPPAWSVASTETDEDSDNQSSRKSSERHGCGGEDHLARYVNTGVLSKSSLWGTVRGVRGFGRFHWGSLFLNEGIRLFETIRMKCITEGPGKVQVESKLQKTANRPSIRGCNLRYGSVPELNSVGGLGTQCASIIWLWGNRRRKIVAKP
ncbi:hypothetical protein BDN67DRAFT_981396 [Paxillus ammoniavirescens]|nr:hypothetical protein BDN67DRAFT_981396 [Paxillus ammoniavirescens]